MVSYKCCIYVWGKRSGVYRNSSIATHRCKISSSSSIAIYILNILVRVITILFVFVLLEKHFLNLGVSTNFEKGNNPRKSMRTFPT